ncbi:hypothetical protein [Asticcacaulis solisilvae]|uniref:hypothetical protein n=1 Tax=Asticcacaulis solisilvae TaxID=1217274 RepID=UPI003FD8BBB4
MSKDMAPESKASELDRKTEALVSNFAQSPSIKTADQLYYIARERADLVSGGARFSGQMRKSKKSVSFFGFGNS